MIETSSFETSRSQETKPLYLLELGAESLDSVKALLDRLPDGEPSYLRVSSDSMRQLLADPALCERINRRKSRFAVDAGETDLPDSGADSLFLSRSLRQEASWSFAGGSPTASGIGTLFLSCRPDECSELRGWISGLKDSGLEVGLVLRIDLETSVEELSWKMYPALELKRNLAPKVSIFFSRSFGDGRAWATLAGMALRLGADGLALAAASIQGGAVMETVDLKRILTTWRDDLRGTPSGCRSLDELRRQIDSLDRSLLDILVQRLEIVGRMGRLKTEVGLSFHQSDRWQTVLNTRQQWGADLGLDPELIVEVFDAIHRRSLARQVSACQTQA